MDANGICGVLANVAGPGVPGGRQRGIGDRAGTGDGRARGGAGVRVGGRGWEDGGGGRALRVGSELGVRVDVAGGFGTLFSGAGSSYWS